MKLHIRSGDASFDAEGPDAFVLDTSRQFQRIVLELQLKECQQRIADSKAWERGLKRALKALDEQQAAAAVDQNV